MSAPIIDVAEEVKDLLNAGDFSKTFTAVRTYVPQLDLEDLQSLAAGTVSLFVIPKKGDRIAHDRAGNAHEIQVDIGIRCKLAAAVDPTVEAANTTLDALMDFVEEIKAAFGPSGTSRLPSTRATWLKTENPAIYDTASLLTERVFLSVVTFTFRKL